jgi:hypothetical protein
MMNTKSTSTEKFRITGDWAMLSKLLKKKYSQLTDADLVRETNGDDELLHRLQRRLSRNRDGIIEILKGLEAPAPAAHTSTMKIVH